MRISVIALLFLLAVSGAGFAAGGEDVVFEERPGRLEFSGRLIARPLQVDALAAAGLQPAEIAARREAAARRLAPTLVRYEPITDEYLIRVPAGSSENALAVELMATGNYQYVEPDWVCFPMAIPNDPYFGQQWHHVNMQSALAWDLATGSSSRVAAVCDTGADLDHPDLQAHLVPGYNAVDRIPQSQGGQVGDVNGHGTATIGCVGAIGNNSVGVAGVNWTISLMPVRVSNSSGGSANMSDLTHGALWAAQNGAKTVSVSYTGVESSSVGTTGTAIRNLDALLFWAADNYNQNHSSFDWQDVTVVGATDQNDIKASFSSYGLAIDVMAPGVSIMTTSNGGGYSPVSGTSFSTPLTNGVCALLWSLAPGMSAGDVEQALFVGCDDMGNPTNFGHGRVNVYQSMLQMNMSIAFANGLPEGYQPPGLEHLIQLSIVSGAEDYVPGTGFLHYRLDSGSAYTAVPVTPVGGNDFEVLLPAPEPGDAPEFYFSAQGDGGSTIYSPAGAPGAVYAFEVAFLQMLFADNFQTDTGWTVQNEAVSAGAWERGVPAGAGDRGDPTQDADGSGSCYLTGNVAGDSDVDGGPTRLTSPAIDLSAGTAEIFYSRWFSNDDGDDHFDVHVSNDDGGTWTAVSSTIGGSGGWNNWNFNVADYAAPSAQVRVRFSAADNPNNSVTEAGLDGFAVQRIENDPGLWSEGYAFSAAAGCDIPIHLDAGPTHGGRSYKLVASFSGSQPGTPLPGSGLILPINRDALTNYILAHPASPNFQDFSGSLDGQGRAEARLVLSAGQAAVHTGKTMTFAFALTAPFDYASNAFAVEILP